MKVSRITLAKVYMQSLNKSLIMWLLFSIGLFLTLIYVAITHTPRGIGSSEEYSAEVIKASTVEQFGLKSQQLTVKLENGTQVTVSSTEVAYAPGDNVRVIMHFTDQDKVMSVSLATPSPEGE